MVLTRRETIGVLGLGAAALSVEGPAIGAAPRTVASVSGIASPP